MYSLLVWGCLIIGVSVWFALTVGVGTCIRDCDRADYWRLMTLFHGCIMLAAISEIV